MKAVYHSYNVNQSTESTDGGEFETSVWQYPHQKEGNEFSWTCIVFYFCILHWVLSFLLDLQQPLR